MDDKKNKLLDIEIFRPKDGKTPSDLQRRLGNFKGKECNGVLDVIMIFLLSFCAYIFFCPIFHGRFVFLVCSLAFELLWCVCALIQSPQHFNKSLLNNKIGLFFLAYTVAVPYLFGATSVGNRYTSFSFFVFGAIIWDYCLRNNKVSHVKTTLILLAPVAIIVFFITFRELMVNPYASRLIKSGDQSTSLVGGYGCIYSFVLIFGIILSAYKFINNKFKKYALVSLILIFALALRSNYFTALILCVFSLFVVTCLETKENGKLSIKIVNSLALVFGVVLIELALSGFVTESFIDRVLPNGKTKDRIMNMSGDDSTLSFSGVVEGTSDEFEGGRLKTILSSINNCFNSPIVGSFYRKDVLDYSSGIIGHHSTILDTFSLFGLFVGSAFLVVLCLPFRACKPQLIRCRIAVFSQLVLLGIFDNYTQGIAFVTTIIYPFTIYKLSGIIENEVRFEPNVYEELKTLRTLKRNKGLFPFSFRRKLKNDHIRGFRINDKKANRNFDQFRSK